MSPRVVLRPDLFGGACEAIDEVDCRARPGVCADRDLALAQSRRRVLSRSGAVARRSQSARSCARGPCRGRRSASDAERVGREYFDLFIGLGRGELLPYASYYLTGFLHERPLARLRGDLKRLGIEQARDSRSPRITPRSSARSWPGLAGKTIDAAAGADREIFEKHMAPWMGRFFADLERSPDGGLLRPRRCARPDIHGQ